jgi:hypothetical protein
MSHDSVNSGRLRVLRFQRQHQRFARPAHQSERFAQQPHRIHLRVQFVLNNTTNLSPLIPGDGATYTYQWNVALYLLDYDDRSESITIVDANSPSSVLDARSATKFQNGEYLIWKIQGDVQIQVKTTGGLNGVVSGIFFGPTSTGGLQQPPVVTVTAPPPNRQDSFWLAR